MTDKKIDLGKYKKYTPGEWRVVVFKTTAGATLEVHNEVEVIGYLNSNCRQEQANADLFADAPEILEYARELEALLTIAEDEHKANTKILSALTLMLRCEHYGELEAEVERLQGIVDAQSECMVKSALAEEAMVSVAVLDKMLVDAMDAVSPNEVRDHILKDEETIVVGGKLDFKVQSSAVEMKSRLLAYFRDKIAAIQGGGKDVE